jgi:hypothetical protein
MCVACVVMWCASHLWSRSYLSVETEFKAHVPHGLVLRCDVARRRIKGDTSHGGRLVWFAIVLRTKAVMPHIERSRGYPPDVIVPLWCVLVVLAVPTVMLWRSDRRRPGHCQECGYDLTGNVSGACPECGAKA